MCLENADACFALGPRDDHCIDTREKNVSFPLREKAQLVTSLCVGFRPLVKAFLFCTCTAALNSLSSKEVSATPSETMYVLTQFASRSRMGTLKQCAHELAISGESLETLPSGTESKAVCSRAAYLFYSSEMPSMNEPGFQRLAGWPFNRRLFFFLPSRSVLAKHFPPPPLAGFEAFVLPRVSANEENSHETIKIFRWYYFFFFFPLLFSTKMYGQFALCPMEWILPTTLCCKMSSDRCPKAMGTAYAENFMLGPSTGRGNLPRNRVHVHIPSM